MSIFTEVKENICIQQAAEYLGLKLAKTAPSGERRYKCPVCETKDPDPLCIGKDAFTCYGTGKKPHGDLIALVAHCKEISQTDAAKSLAKHFLAAPASKATKPRQTTADGEGRPGALAGSEARPLELEHPVISLLDIAEVLLEIGGGYSPDDKRIQIPLRDEAGKEVRRLRIATTSDQVPLLDFSKPAEGRPQPKGMEEMRKLLRVV